MTSPILLAESLWLTPVWFISVGAFVGLVLVAVLVALMYFLSSIPGLNSIRENRSVFIPLLIVGTVVLSGLFGARLWFSLSADSTFEGNVGAVGGATIISSLLIVPLSLLITTGLIGMVSRKRIEEVLESLKEGFLLWCNIVFGTLAAFAILGVLLGFASGLGIGSIVNDPLSKLSSLNRLMATGEQSMEFEVGYDPNGENVSTVDVDFVASELRWLQVLSGQPVRLSVDELSGDFELNRTIGFESSVEDDIPVTFNRQPESPQIADEDGHIKQLYVKNEGTASTKVTMTWYTEPEVPQVWIIPWTALFILGIYVLYFTIIAGFPKVSAVAISTIKTELSQPIFQVLLLIGLIFILASIYIPYNTFGEDNKMYKDSAITLVTVLAIFMAVWAASKSVAEEIEGRTALTVLSKPIGRREFIIGKFTGISFAVAVLVLVLGTWLVIWTAYKPIYDGVESADNVTDWTTSFREAVGIVPGLILAAMKVTVFVGLAIAISTRISILANFLICFAVYVLGHLTPMIVASSLAQFAPVAVTGQIIGTIFPLLHHFDVSAAINAESDIPMTFIWMASVYCTIYVAITLLLGFILFEDRDLA